jgi:hypothetical protein
MLPRIVLSIALIAATPLIAQTAQTTDPTTQQPTSNNAKPN